MPSWRSYIFQSEFSPAGFSIKTFRDRKVYKHMSELVLAVRPDGSAYLMHHGVKGMKWGVRKDRGSHLSNWQFHPGTKRPSISKYRPGSNARIDNAVNKFKEWYNQPHGVKPSNRKRPGRGARKVWINGLGEGYTPTSLSNPSEKPSVAQTIIQNHINSWNANAVGYTLNELGRTTAKLRRTMRTNLYSPETKIQLGMQMTGKMLGDVGGLVFNTPQGQAAVAVGAAAITAAVVIKRRRDEKKINDRATQAQRLAQAKSEADSYHQKGLAEREEYKKYLDSAPGPERRQLTKTELKTSRAYEKRIENLSKRESAAYAKRIDIAGEGSSKDEHVIADRKFKGEGSTAKYSKALANRITKDADVAKAVKKMNKIDAGKDPDKFAKAAENVGKKAIKTYIKLEPSQSIATDIGYDAYDLQTSSRSRHRSMQRKIDRALKKV